MMKACRRNRVLLINAYKYKQLRKCIFCIKYFKGSQLYFLFVRKNRLEYMNRMFLLFLLTQ